MLPTLAKMALRSSNKFFPKMRISPALGLIKESIQRIVVLFPAPLGPKNPNTSPLLTVKLTFFTASNEPNDFCKPLTSIIACCSMFAN